ncbi:MAG: hypothetical protein IJZ32_03655 [Clostridia bacterium]|nr:hypothetical protein [Clostridia bacterium]
MEKKKKACWNCGNYCAYYERNFYRFNKTNAGRCSVKKEVVKNTYVCERWRNTFRILSRRKEFTLNVLNDILTDIAAIRQILEEENEESMTHPGHKDV